MIFLTSVYGIGHTRNQKSGLFTPTIVGMNRSFTNVLSHVFYRSLQTILSVNKEELDVWTSGQEGQCRMAKEDGSAMVRSETVCR